MRLRKVLLPSMLATLVVAGAMASAQDGPGYARWWDAGSGETFPATADYANAQGTHRIVLEGGPLNTSGHPFFEPLGPTGRACVTCHQPADGMSLSAASARERWDATGGADPLFAAYDGSNCPTLPQGDRASHSLLLDHGLIRIQRAWPPRDRDGEIIEPDFDIAVMRDPWGCNSGDVYGLNAAEPNISVYRRPRPAANLRHQLAYIFSGDPKSGLPLEVDPATGLFMSGNMMADSRAKTLRDQAGDAGDTHLRMASHLTDEDIARIVSFEENVYVAQQSSRDGGALTAAGAKGGADALAEAKEGMLRFVVGDIWTEFQPWEDDPGTGNAAERDYRASVARGARLFREKTFLIADTAGISAPIGFGSPQRNSCVLCHNMLHIGSDAVPGQVDIGTNNRPFAEPLGHLPLFRVRCTGRPHPHFGRDIFTTDPGYALTTGRCRDVGKIVAQQFRGLSARAPYFANGSAKDIPAIIDYYDRRFNIGYTAQERQDMINLLSAL